jgi:hypothetical protein
MKMPTTKFTDLATHLRSWGLKVQEVSGWQTRSSNWSRSFTPKGVVCHHTAGPTGNGNYPSYNTVLNGRTGLAGPLSQFGLGRDGLVYLIGGHRANHAGVGGPLVGIPQDSANAYMWGIEAENSGTQAWPAVQVQAYARLVAALACYDKAPFKVGMVIGHKEWAPGRKPDPSFDMNAFRTNVQKAINAGKPGTPKPTPPTGVVPAGGGTSGAKVDALGNPKYGAGPYDGRWTRGPVPRYPLYLDTIYLAIGLENGTRHESLDAWEKAYIAKVVDQLQYLAKTKGGVPQKTIVNLVKQVQTLWFDKHTNYKFYGLFDRKLFDLFTIRQGWSFWDGDRN